MQWMVVDVESSISVMTRDGDNVGDGYCGMGDDDEQRKEMMMMNGGRKLLSQFMVGQSRLSSAACGRDVQRNAKTSRPKLPSIDSTTQHQKCHYLMYLMYQ